MEIRECSSSADIRLAERLRALRRARSWSLDELSALSAVSRASLSRIENGEVSPTASVLGRLAGAHRTTVSRLLADIEGERAGARQAERTAGMGRSGHRLSPPAGLAAGGRLRLRASVLRIAGRRAHRLSASAASGSRTSSLSHGRRSGTDRRGDRPSPARRRLPSVQADGPEPFRCDWAGRGALHSRSEVRSWTPTP